MDSRTIAKIYKEQVASFLKHLKEAKRLDEEVVHKLRVDIKQLRSLYRFLEILSKNKFHRKKIQKKLSLVFDTAGELRATALNIKLTKKRNSKILFGFKLFLGKKAYGQEKEFLRALKKFDKKGFEKLSKKALYYFNKKDGVLVNKASKEHIGSLFTDIQTEMPNIVNDENFHGIRKKLKDIKTINSLLEGFKVDRVLTSRYKKIKSIEEKIGEWHDRFIFITELEVFISHNLSKYLSRAKKTKKNNGDNEKLSLLVIDLKAKNELNKKNIAEKLKKKIL
ncbi:MAG: CHAD domain-containing protein [Bacteroidia bacterium]